MPSPKPSFHGRRNQDPVYSTEGPTGPGRGAWRRTQSADRRPPPRPASCLTPHIFRPEARGSNTVALTLRKQQRVRGMCLGAESKQTPPSRSSCRGRLHSRQGHERLGPSEAPRRHSSHCTVAAVGPAPPAPQAATAHRAPGAVGDRDPPSNARDHPGCQRVLSTRATLPQPRSGLHS